VVTLWAHSIEPGAVRCTSLMARLLVRDRCRRAWDGAPRLRPTAHALRRTRTDGATFYTTGMEHSPTSATGTGWEPTPWHATQRAAWDALDRAHRP